MDWLLALGGGAFLGLIGWMFKDRLDWQARMDRLEDHLKANGDGWLRDKVARMDREIGENRHDINNVKQLIMNAGEMKPGDDWRFRHDKL